MVKEDMLYSDYNVYSGLITVTEMTYFQTRTPGVKNPFPIMNMSIVGGVRKLKNPDYSDVCLSKEPVPRPYGKPEKMYCGRILMLCPIDCSLRLSNHIIRVHILSRDWGYLHCKPPNSRKDPSER